MARITVRYKPTGEMGTIPDYEYDPSIYEAVQGYPEAADIASKTTQTGVTEDKNIMEKLGDLGVGILGRMAKPFQTTGRNLALLGQVAASQPAFLGAVTGGTKSEDEIAQLAAKIASADIGGTQEQARLISEEPTEAVKKQLGASADILSYAVPFGKARAGAGLAERALTKAVLPGMVSGGMQALGEDEVTPESVLGSAALGGIVAPVLHGVGKVGGMFKMGGEVAEETGKRVRKIGATKITLRPDVYGHGREQAVEKTLDKLKIHGTTSQRYAKLQPAMEKLGKDITEELATNPTTTTLDDLVRVFQKKAKETIRRGDLSSKQAQKEMEKYVMDLMEMTDEQLLGDIPTSKIFDAKKLIHKDMHNMYTKLDAGRKITNTEKVMKAVRDTFDSIIAKNNPEVKALTKQQGHLYDAAASLGRGRINPPVLRVAGTSLPRGVVEGATNITGAAVEKAGALPRAIGGGIEAIGREFGEAGARVGARAPSIITGMPSKPTVIGEEEITPDLSERAVDLATQPQAPQQQPTLTGYSPEQLYQGYMNALAAGDKTAASSLMKMFNDETKYRKEGAGKAPTVAQMARNDMVSSIQRIHSLFSQHEDKLGKFAGYTEGLKSVVNKGDQDVLDFYNAASQLKATLAKARAGTSFTPNEEALLNEYTPKKGDSIQQLRTKINGLLTLTDSLSRPISETAGEYDINQQAIEQALY